MGVDLLLSALIDNVVGRAFLVATRFWIRSAIREVASTTKIEWGNNPSVITGLAYPNMLFPLRIVSKTNMELTLEQIKAQVNFEGLNAGTLFWFQDQDGTIEKKSDKDVVIDFIPPSQVFLLNLAKCHLYNGIANLSCSLGKVTVSFSADPRKIDNFEQGVKIVRGLLSPE